MLSALQTWSFLHMLLAAAVAAGASWSLRRRVVSRDSRAAALALRCFWAGLGGTALVQSAMLVMSAAGVGPALALATLLLAYATSVVALGALAAYFAFVFTGSRKAVPIMVAVYAAVLALGSWSVVRSDPTGLRLMRWSYEAVFAHEPSGLLAAAPALAALLPAIGGAIAFLVLGLRSTGPTRQRGILVGAALVLWFGSTLALNSGAVESDAAHVAQRLASMAGFGAVFVAYLAPRRLQERWGLVGLGEEREFHGRQVARTAAKRRMGEALDARVRELV